MSDAPLDPKNLRERATRCRRLAGDMRDDSIKDRLYLIAQEYEAMASQEELRVSPRKPRDIAARMVAR